MPFSPSLDLFLSLSFICIIYLLISPSLLSSFSYFSFLFFFFFCLCFKFYLSSARMVSTLYLYFRSLLPRITVSPDFCWLYLSKGQLCKISIQRSFEIQCLKRATLSFERRKESYSSFLIKRSNKFPGRVICYARFQLMHLYIRRT